MGDGTRHFLCLTLFWAPFTHFGLSKEGVIPLRPGYLCAWHLLLSCYPRWGGPTAGLVLGCDPGDLILEAVTARSQSSQFSAGSVVAGGLAVCFFWSPRGNKWKVLDSGSVWPEATCL